MIPDMIVKTYSGSISGGWWWSLWFLNLVMNGGLYNWSDTLRRCFNSYYCTKNLHYYSTVSKCIFVIVVVQYCLFIKHLNYSKVNLNCQFEKMCIIKRVFIFVYVKRRRDCIIIYWEIEVSVSGGTWNNCVRNGLDGALRFNRCFSLSDIICLVSSQNIIKFHFIKYNF